MHKRQRQLYAIKKVHWNSRLQMVMHSPKRSRAWKGVERTKIQGCHFILQVKSYTRPTRYRTVLLIADSEKNNDETLELLLLNCVIRNFHLYVKKDLYFAPKI